ncbi:MAG: hypothetical protein ACMG6E_08770 [Candidatus Roizmanbacteria bacterium]
MIFVQIVFVVVCIDLTSYDRTADAYHCKEGADDLTDLGLLESIVAHTHVPAFLTAIQQIIIIILTLLAFI